MRSTVRGVLNGHAAGAGTPWVLVLHLRPWRVVGEPLASVELRLEIPAPQESIRELMEPLNDGLCVEVEIDSLTPRESDVLAIGGLPVRIVEADRELRDARAKLDEPVVIDDRELGKLTLDRKFNWFDGTRRAAIEYSISVHRSGATDDAARDARDLEDARGRVLAFETRLAEIMRAIANDKLALYNDTWRDEDEGDPEIDAEEFIARVSLSSVVVSKTRTTAYFDDGGLFLGHTIELRMEPSGEIAEICLAG